MEKNIPVTAKRELIPDGVTRPIGPYSLGVEVGDFVMCAGQIGIDPKTGLIKRGIVAQTAQTLENLRGVLKVAGLDLNDVVKVTVFLTDMNDFPQMNEEYAKHFLHPYPVRSTVQVSALPTVSAEGGETAKVEIDAIALKKK